MLSFGPHKVLLESERTSFGDRYAGGGYVFADRRHSIVLTRPDEEPVDCYAEGRGRPGGGSGGQPGGRPGGGFADPSFPCVGNLNAAERQICAAPPLARLDRRMADAYQSLRERIGGRETFRLKRDQEDWLSERNACGDRFRCLEDIYRERIAALNEWEAPEEPQFGPPRPPLGPPFGPPPVASGLPRPAISWGGIVRSGPGTQFARLTSTTEGTRITILSNTGIKFNGFDWFEIRYGDLRGFQWGGIICPIGAPLSGTFQSC
jgi:hypothetical protein